MSRANRASGATLLEPGRDDMLPAVKPGIDGPLSGPDQRQRHAKHRQCGGNTRMGRRREGDPSLGARRHNAGAGRPQTGNEQKAGQRSNHLRCRNRRWVSRPRSIPEQRRPATAALKAGARPTVRERGEQPLHNTPTFIANPNIDRGSSDFDIRHAFTSGLTYSLPTPGWNQLARTVLNTAGR